jgi:hypothetical protein
MMENILKILVAGFPDISREVTNMEFIMTMGTN